MSQVPGTNAIYSRILTHADRLFEALDEVEAVGGLRRVTAEMKPASRVKAVEILSAVRDAIDNQLVALARPAPKPAKRTLLRRQANR